jgi:DNA-binding NarL/FixJ family response regulator
MADTVTFRAGTAGGREGAPVSETQSTSSTTVLVVDDDQAIRDTIRDVVEVEPGWRLVAEATDGREAIHLAEELQPDVVVLDLMLPVMSGIDALPQIVHVAPRSTVVMLTAHPGARELIDAAALGAAATMEKTALTQLPAVIRDLLGTAHGAVG